MKLGKHLIIPSANKSSLNWLSKALIFALALTFGQLDAKIYTPENLPSIVSKAISIRAIVKNTNKVNTQPEIILELEHFNKYKTYKEKFKIQVLKPGTETVDTNWKVEYIQEPKTKTFLDPVTKTIKHGYYEQSEFQLKLTNINTSKNAFEAFNQNIPLLISLQSCSKTTCLVPIKIKIVTNSTKNTKIESKQKSFLAKIFNWLS